MMAQIFFLSIQNDPEFMNTHASGRLTCSGVSISSSGRIPSTPGDLLSFIV